MASPMAGPTSLNSRPLLSYNVLESVLCGCECGIRQGSHNYTPLSQPLLQPLPGVVVANKDTCVVLRVSSVMARKNHALTLIRPEVDRLPLAIAKE